MGIFVAYGFVALLIFVVCGFIFLGYVNGGWPGLLGSIIPVAVLPIILYANADPVLHSKVERKETETRILCTLITDPSRNFVEPN